MKKVSTAAAQPSRKISSTEATGLTRVEFALLPRRRTTGRAPDSMCLLQSRLLDYRSLGVSPPSNLSLGPCGDGSLRWRRLNSQLPLVLPTTFGCKRSALHPQWRAHVVARDLGSDAHTAHQGRMHRAELRKSTVTGKPTFLNASRLIRRFELQSLPARLQRVTPSCCLMNKTDSWNPTRYF